MSCLFQELDFTYAYLNLLGFDCFLIILGHINNLQNTSFWKLVQDGGLTPNEAQKRLEVRY